MEGIAQPEDDENQTRIQPCDNCPSKTLTIEDSSYTNEMSNSADSVSDIGEFSLESNTIQNVATSSHCNSTTYCQSETIQNNVNNQSRILNRALNNEQAAVLGGAKDFIPELRQSSDINIVVYTETNISNVLQNNNEETSGDYLHRLDHIDSSKVQLEVVKYPLETNSWNDDHYAEASNYECHKNNAISLEKMLDDVFHCDKCGKIFFSKSRLAMHIEQHSNHIFKCTHCSYATKSSKLLYHHQNIHNGKFKCKFCSKLFTRKIYLKYHIKDIHRQTRRFHNCEECNAKFMSISGLKMHMQSVHEPLKTYPCTLCNYKGSSTNCLASHMVRNHKKKYKCITCDYSSLTQGGLDKHTRICHNSDDRQFACKHCSYRGLKRRQLLDHEKIVHSQNKNRHVCPVCKKSFRTQVLMKHHLPSHSDQHFYRCRGCNYTTRYRQTFHLHLKHSHPGETFKNLCKAPSEADFETIINTALKNLEQFPSCDEQNMEIDYTAQAPEDCSVVEDPNHLLSVSVLSMHSAPQGISFPSHDMVNCEEVSSNHIPTLLQCESPKKTKPVINAELTDSTIATEEVVNTMHELKSGIVESDQAVTVIGGSGLTNDEVQTIVNLAGDLSVRKQEIHHLVTLSDGDTEKTLFPLSEFSLEANKIHQVVTLVGNSEPLTEANQEAVTLLNNIVQNKGPELSTVTHISLTGNSDPSQENIVILPLGDAKVAIIQNDNFSSIQTNSHIVLDEQTALLDLIPEQNELAQQVEEGIRQVAVYHLDN